MPQSLAKILIHIVFGTKDRYPFLTIAVRPELHAYVATVLKTNDCPGLAINSVANHMHILCALSRTWSVSDLIKDVKTSTSKWIKVETVKAYIAQQETHHQRVTYEDELRSLLAKHGMDYDERYVWD